MTLLSDVVPELLDFNLMLFNQVCDHPLLSPIVLEHNVELSLMITLEPANLLEMPMLQLLIEPSEAEQVLGKLGAHEREGFTLGREDGPRLFLEVLNLRSQALDAIFIGLVQLGEELEEFEHLASR